LTSEFYSKIKNLNQNNQDSFCFICTPETQISDLIGRLIPTQKTDVGNEIIIWKDDPLTSAILNGQCGVIDNIEFAPPKISERLNSLLDPKESPEEMIFEIPENSKNFIIQIHPDFRLIATCCDKNLDSLSHALINRFNVIYHDYQLIDLSSEELLALINFLFHSHLDQKYIENVPVSLCDTIFQVYNEIFSKSPSHSSMSFLSKFCSCSAKLSPFTQDVKSISIAKFVLNLFDNKTEFHIPKLLKKNIYKKNLMVNNHLIMKKFIFKKLNHFII
jgi:hypothetical protein